MLANLRGQIERITYFNEENNYTVARLKVYGNRDLVTVVGNLAGVNPGEILEISGEWTNHPRYGSQFKIINYKSVMPASVYGIQKYLGSGMIKGIGPIMARRLVARFGKETLNIIEHDIKKLKEVSGIGQKRVSMIKKAWDAQKEIREVMIFLQGHGVSSGYATKIFKEYGNESIEIVKENPFRLATDIFGIGFITADKIAEKMGIPKNALIRAEAGILYVLNQLSDEGHVYFPQESLIKKCQEILEVERETVINALENIATRKKIVVEAADDEPARSPKQRAVYLAKFHFSEVSMANRLKNFTRIPKNIRSIDTDKAVQWVQGQLDIKLTERQRAAVKDAVDNKVIVVTGGPGTGKTTIINSIIKIYRKIGLKALLAAPTGRAAKRMNEATGHEARTIHRLLEYSIQRGGFKKDDQNPLDADVIIIDEVSMIDTILMHHLLKAIPITATLILVGDINQLPSVGAGNVLKDIIDSGIFPVAELSEIFRQAKESLIVVNAHKINRGEFPSLKNLSRNQKQDFYFIEQEDPDQVLRLILNLIKDRIPKTFGFNPLDDIQVLTPMHRGIVGAENLNSELQSELNLPTPSSAEITRGGKTFRRGDKVMQIRNNYDHEVFNGDIGRIDRIDPETQEVVIRFDERPVKYEYSDLDEIVLAYAISIHKSQGSEYPAVIIPVMTQHYVLLQRNLIYTAITRGKRLVILIGTKKALAIAIKNDKTQLRYTRLKERLERSLK
jgi:exodeoxyribonuclease V alpha subunit